MGSQAPHMLHSARESTAASLKELTYRADLKEVAAPTVHGRNIADCADFLSFVCGQLGLARVVDERFLNSRRNADVRSRELVSGI